MARKTKAELAAEQAAFMADRQVVMVQEYPARLMSALEKATKKLNYELAVKDQKFVLFNRDTSTFFVPALPLVFDTESYYDLEELESELRYKMAVQAAEDAKFAARQAALNKLTKDERQLLDLPNY